MLIKIIGDGAIARSGMRRAIFGWECECDRIFSVERLIALYLFFSTRGRSHNTI
ncbi:hypothetical protein [Microcoleus sp. POL10_C6]|uniref:hypothetical protein n=1 Tax=Microcoleus sp. POL10_C6 TaxID=2818852 RepID=UPI002FD71531